MILQNFTIQGYFLVILATFVLMLVDSMFTNINAKIYEDYWMIEFLPWLKYSYKGLPFAAAVVVSMLSNAAIFLFFIFMRIKITWFMALFGFMVYRVAHSMVRFWQIRRMAR